ncbi:MAG: pyruvate, phosphate dikinase [Acidimicrobiia bacterium]|nr:pyruvate, phosphate dikinase [Acidimicrobiia bacterium]
MSERWVYLFDEADGGNRDLLGGKGAGLAEMTAAGLPVPPGFIITTDACRSYTQQGHEFPESMWEQALEAMAGVEKLTGKTFGGAENPLLVSVRSGAKASMPGMMDTILNLGLNDESTEGLAKATGDAQFAWQARVRFIQMFGDIVFGVPALRLSEIAEAARKQQNGARPAVEESIALVDRLQSVIYGYAHQRVPEDPAQQLELAISAVFNSWSNKRAVDYRKVAGIPEDLGTGVTVQAMVFGNTGAQSGTGVAFTRDPGSGVPGIFGEYLPDAQGEDVVAGIRTPHPISMMQDDMPDAYSELIEIADRLEKHYRDMQDMEFTVENGRFWMLQTRTGKRTGRAAVRIAVDLVADGLITVEEALGRVDGSQIEQLLHPVVAPGSTAPVLATGLPASPGAAAGVVVLDSEEAVALSEQGKPVILVRHETSPDDFSGMVASQAIVTARGGVTSHAAVVARGIGKCCVVGCSDLMIDETSQVIQANGIQVAAGEWVTVDGTTGQILVGEVETIEPELDDAYYSLMQWADEKRRLRVRANADTPVDAAKARELGAEGIGLCRTEHMFFAGDRIETVRQMIMAPNNVARAEALAKLEPHQVQDFIGIFEAMDGFPVTIRLLDPPLHEFLPRHDDTALQITDLKLQLSRAENLQRVDAMLGEIHELEAMLHQVSRLTEQNPMLGHRGVRLGIAYPQITEMQSRAIFTAAARCAERGITVLPEIMIPLVAFSPEFDHQAAIVRQVGEEVLGQHGINIDYLVGTMIELPRAALTAHEIAENADFFSFGTNDLTQSTCGLSRDDAPRFLGEYVREGVIKADPFQTIDVDGVGQLVRLGTERGRSAKPDLKVGVCGEHGGDPASIRFFDSLGLHYVSCSPYRVPVARLAAARASLESKQ